MSEPNKHPRTRSALAEALAEALERAAEDRARYLDERKNRLSIGYADDERPSPDRRVVRCG